MKIFRGRKLEYEPKHSVKQGNEMDFLTAIEFSIEDPYGKAVALLNLRSKLVMVPYFLAGCYYYILGHVWFAVANVHLTKNYICRRSINLVFQFILHQDVSMEWKSKHTLKHFLLWHTFVLILMVRVLCILLIFF